jgi:5-methylcytosine-specific restriction enzyme subunit McrC
MSGITIHEFDALTTAEAVAGEGLHVVPDRVFKWLEAQCLRTADASEAGWLKLTQRQGRRVVKVTSYVGVIQSPDGYQIEVLPKVGKAIDGGDGEARKLLIDMLRCLGDFRHIQTDSAHLAATRMPLLEVFIGEFLRAVEHIVKRGLRGDYLARRDNLPALRGKLLMATHLRQNLCRADRFFTEHDEFTTNRAENRLLHTALLRALYLSSSSAHQRLARTLGFVFADVPVSSVSGLDFLRVRLDRGMGYYADALAWARLILDEVSPLTGTGKYLAPSLLFPMEKVFETFVARHLARQLRRPCKLTTQASGRNLVRHREQDWFRLKPDFLVRDGSRNRLALDTKWKLLDAAKSRSSEHYGLAQADFYQLHAYGCNYLEGQGDIALIYPRTDDFDRPLPVFGFPKTQGLRLWVLPFSLRERQLHLPETGELNEFFRPGA